MSDKPPEEPSPEELAVMRNTNDFDAVPVVAQKPNGTRRKPPVTYGGFLPDIHRLLPQDSDAEQGVLSSFLLAPKEVGALCEEKGVDREFFHIPAHSEIFRVLYELWIARRPIDIITLTAELRDRKRLDQVGGPAFVTDLFCFLPTAANAAYYIEILEEKFTLREIIRVCTEYAARCYDEQGDVTKLLDNVESQILSISRDRYQSATMMSPKDAVMAAVHMIEELYANRGKVNGIATGFHKLDLLTDGLQKGEMFVIAGRPSMGKTALAMNIAENVAVNLRIPVGVFSLEMTTKQLMLRMLCSRARVDLSAVRNGFLNDRDFPALTQAASKLAEAPIHIDDSSDLNIQQLRSRARRMVQKYGVGTIFVDYLGLLKSSTKRGREDRQQEVAEISGGLKAMAKELNIPVVVLAQISRKFDERGLDGTPRLSDLRESGAIEQDADTVAFINRPEFYAVNDEDRNELRGRAEVTIAKARNGPTGRVGLIFLSEYTRFENRATTGDEEEETQFALPGT